MWEMDEQSSIRACNRLISFLAQTARLSCVLGVYKKRSGQVIKRSAIVYQLRLG